MRSDTSSRRGFFGKTLAFFGAAFACSKAAAAPDNAAAPASKLTLPSGCHTTFYQYDDQGELDWEGGVTTYRYSEPIEYGSVPLSECAYCEFDFEGRITTVTFRDSL